MFVVVLFGAAGGCKDSSRDAAATGVAKPAREEVVKPSQRTRLHPHRALLDEASRAELDAGGLLLDLGAAEQHKYTRGGWRTGWGDRHDGKGEEPAQWIEQTGRRAWLDVIVPAPGPSAIVLRARSRVPDQKISFFAGEVELGTVELGTAWTTTRVGFQPGRLPPGPVRFELRAAKEGKPRAEIDWLWMANATAPAEPLLAPRVAPVKLGGHTRRALLAPDARSYAFYLEPPAGAHFVADLGVAEQATFQIAVTRDGGERRVLLQHAATTPGWHEQAVSLADYAGVPVRIELTTTAQTGAAAWGEPELLVEAAPAAVASGAPPAKNVIVLVMDTARADAFGPYAGKDRVFKTPSFDALAARSTVFTSAYNNENWTKPSVATILSGLYPTTHDTKKDSSKLPNDVELLSERLKKEGFTTAGFVANGYVSDKFGFEQGWDKFTNYIRESRNSAAEVVFGEALAWLKKHTAPKTAKPFFLYIQSIDPHVNYDVDKKYWSQYYDGTYSGPLGPTISAADQVALSTKKIPQSDDNVAWLRALYGGELTYSDEHFGVFLAALDELGIRDETLLVITNDHGEELGERGRFGHGHQIYEEMIRAPLLVSYDPMFPPGARVDEVVEHVDLAPTILEVLGRAPLAAADGLSFLPLVDGKPYQRPRYAIIEFLDSWRAVRVGSLKLFASAGDKARLFDVAADPAEAKDLAGGAPIALRLAQIHLGEGLAMPDKKGRSTGLAGKRRFRSGNAKIDPAMRRQLEALGYFGSDQDSPPPDDDTK